MSYGYLVDARERIKSDINTLASKLCINFGTEEAVCCVRINYLGKWSVYTGGACLSEFCRSCALWSPIQAASSRP